MQQLDLALSTGLSLKGNRIQPSGLLPLTSPDNTLPLQDRAQPTATDVEFLSPLEDEGADDRNQDTRMLAVKDHSNKQVVAFNSAGLGVQLQQLLDECTMGGMVLFRVSDMAPSRKKRPLGSVDNIQSFDFAIRAYRILDVQTDMPGMAVEKMWACQGSQSEVPLVQIFNSKSPEQTIAGMIQWEVQAGTKPGHPNAFLLKPVGQVFKVRVGVPRTLATVDVDKGLKPTLFELHLLLQQEGWAWRSTANVSSTQIKRCLVTLNNKMYFQRGFWHCLVLLNLTDLMRVQPKVYHGQLESYYEAIFRLSAQGPAFFCIRALCYCYFDRNCFLAFWHLHFALNLLDELSQP